MKSLTPIHHSAPDEPIESEAVGFRLRIQELESENAELRAQREAAIALAENILKTLGPVAKPEREVQPPFSKEEIVRRVREAREGGGSVAEIAKRYGLSESTVYLYLKEKPE